MIIKLSIRDAEIYRQNARSQCSRPTSPCINTMCVVVCHAMPCHVRVNSCSVRSRRHVHLSRPARPSQIAFRRTYHIIQCMRCTNKCSLPRRCGRRQLRTRHRHSSLLYRRCGAVFRMDESRPEVDCLSQAPGPIGGEDVNLHATVGGWEEASRRHDCRQRIVVSGGRWPVASPLVARSAAGLHPCVAAAGADDFVSGHHNLQGCEPPWWRVGGVVGRWWVGAVPVVTCAGGLARGLTVGPSRCCSACPRWRGPKCGC